MHSVQEFYTNRAVLVTGGAGFIGSHIVDLLVNYGAQVTVLDNLSTGNLANLATVLSAIQFIKGNITDFQTCLEATQNQSVIFHCAALVSVPESVASPQICHEINVHGLNNILEAARINNVERVLFSSSSAVYGAQEEPCGEEMVCKPTSPYGFSKLMGELYCQQYYQVYGLPTLCLRYFNVYGPRQKHEGPYSSIMAKLQHQLAHNQPITLFGDGSQTRDFVSVEKVAAANIQLATSKTICTGQAINIAQGVSMSLLELIKQLKQKFPDYKHPIAFGPPRPGDIQHSQADCTKLQSLLPAADKNIFCGTINRID